MWLCSALLFLFVLELLDHAGNLVLLLPCHPDNAGIAAEFSSLSCTAAYLVWLMVHLSLSLCMQGQPYVRLLWLYHILSFKPYGIADYHNS